MNETQDPTTATATGTGGGSTADPGPQVDRDSMRDLAGLRRSREDRYVAGVAGGLGRHFGIDPTIIRVVLVALTIVGGAGLLLYGAAWLVVPEEGHDRALIRLNDELVKIVLGAAAVIAALSLVGSGWWWGGGRGFFWPLGIAAVVCALVVSSANRRHATTASAWTAPTAQHAPPAGTPGTAGTAGTAASTPAHTIDVATAASAPAPSDPPAPTAPLPPGSPAVAPTPGTPYDVPPPVVPTGAAVPPRPSRPRRSGPILFWPTIALIAIGAGLLGVYAADHHVVPAAWPGLALAITGAMLVLGAFVGRPGGLILLGFVLLPPLAIASVLGHAHWETTPRDYAPSMSTDVHDHYRIDNGRLDLDLSKLADPAGLSGRTITIDINAGDVAVTLPSGIDTRIDASLGFAGDVEVADRDQSGFSPRIRELVRNGGAQNHGVAPVVLDVHGRVGHINIERY